MSSFFYARLAITNLRNNRKTYTPYILTCIGTIMMFYNVAALSFNSTTGNGNLGALMNIGMLVTAVFAFIFLFYTNSFLVKRRKKEFGLFNLLGMEKFHIARIMLWESVFSSGISFVGGLGLGILVSKFFTLLLYKILSFDPKYTFEISSIALLVTIGLFAFVFLLTLLNSVRQVYTSKSIELLNGTNAGEKEPKSNILIALLGVVTLGIGYWLAITIESPLKALEMFFVAVILVIIGTYCLFIAGSITGLKLLRKNKKFYYKTKNFIAVSGMIYRMKQNAAGLASICIMSTAVLVMISTTVSMYNGMNDLIDGIFPNDMQVQVSYEPEKEYYPTKIYEIIAASLDKNDIEIENLKQYEELSFACVRDSGKYMAYKNNNIDNEENLCMINILTANEYMQMGGQPLNLSSGEVAVYADEDMDSINIMGNNYIVSENLIEKPQILEQMQGVSDIIYVIVTDKDTLKNIYYQQSEVYGENKSILDYYISFDFVSKDKEEIKAFLNDHLIDDIFAQDNDEQKTHYSLGYMSKQQGEDSFMLLYGGLFFLGIFLGALFLMATVLIIYYKQIIEGYDDKERFEIMQKVGMSRDEVKSSIKAQVLTVFALPLLVAIIHIVAAFPMLTKLLAILKLTNVHLFVICTIATIAIFALIYILVYAATAREYYKIVNS